jgi:hypothetical protein
MKTLYAGKEDSQPCNCAGEEDPSAKNPQDDLKRGVILNPAVFALSSLPF